METDVRISDRDDRDDWDRYIIGHERDTQLQLVLCIVLGIGAFLAFCVSASISPLSA